MGKVGSLSCNNKIFSLIFFQLLVALICSKTQAFGAVNTKENSKTKINDEGLGRSFLAYLDNEANDLCKNRTLMEWNYASDTTQANRAAATKATVEFLNFWKRMGRESQEYNWTYFKDPYIKRQFKHMSVLGLSALKEDRIRMYNTAKQNMELILSSAKICKPSDMTDCKMTIEPEITELMMTSRNESELRSVWVQWRNATGKKMRMDYVKLAALAKEISYANNFMDITSYETRSYERDDFLGELESLWTQLQPFYKELHAYVRRKLAETYGLKIVPKDGPIPSHLLGNMWAQSWTNIFDILVPFKNAKSIDATYNMLKLRLTPRQMAEKAEDFFVSLGFDKLPQEFWTGSILEKPADKEMICHASSWDMCDGKNFRIKQCTRINMEDLITLHHEMGHTMYQIQYKDHPKLFRDGANPAFHEAIGDLVSLSVQTPEHLHKIRLLDEVENSPESDINYLLLMALEKIAFLPFGLIVDKWRWDVINGKIRPEDYNCEWWKLRLNFQGVSPPEVRTEDDFDPGSKYHVASNSGYIRYFISTIIQFQFHQSLCQTAGQFDPTSQNSPPLHKCDIYNSKDAGEKLINMLKLGSSKPWPDAMEVLTGQREMDARPILDYFKPLITWLQNDNKKHNVSVGWKLDKPYCVRQNSNGSRASYQNEMQNIFNTISIALVLFLSRFCISS